MCEIFRDIDEHARGLPPKHLRNLLDLHAWIPSKFQFIIGPRTEFLGVGLDVAKIPANVCKKGALRHCSCAMHLP